MTEPSAYNARIRAKGLDSTGVTESLAKTLYSSLGAHGLAIVEYRVEDRKENADGRHQVDLVLTQVEPSTAQFLDDHLREVMRALYRNRAVSEGQGALPGTDGGPSLRDVVTSGEAVLTRDEDGAPDGVWDGNTDDVSLSCAFPGCRLENGHDGDHDPFLPDSAADDAADGERRLAAVPDPFKS